MLFLLRSGIDVAANVDTALVVVSGDNAVDLDRNNSRMSVSLLRWCDLQNAHQTMPTYYLQHKAANDSGRHWDAITVAHLTRSAGTANTSGSLILKLCWFRNTPKDCNNSVDEVQLATKSQFHESTTSVTISADPAAHVTFWPTISNHMLPFKTAMFNGQDTLLTDTMPHGRCSRSCITVLHWR